MKWINIDTVQQDNIIMQKITLMQLISASVCYQDNEGTHLSFAFGIGPIEFDWTIRIWTHGVNYDA